MTMDNILKDTTEWTPDAEAPQAQQSLATDGGQPSRASVQGSQIVIPAESVTFWLQVAQLAVLVLILLKQ